MFKNIAIKILKFNFVITLCGRMQLMLQQINEKIAHRCASFHHIRALYYIKVMKIAINYTKN